MWEDSSPGHTTVQSRVCFTNYSGVIHLHSKGCCQLESYAPSYSFIYIVLSITIQADKIPVFD